MRKIYQTIAIRLQAMQNCEKSGNFEWYNNHRDSIESLVKEHMPSGSGVDSGTALDIEESTPNKLIFNTAFHHMNDGGYYDGWTYHRVIVTPDLATSYKLRITGRDRNAIKDYLFEIFDYALNSEHDETRIAA